jgi:hypothetical protein
MGFKLLGSFLPSMADVGAAAKKAYEAAEEAKFQLTATKEQKAAREEARRQAKLQKEWNKQSLRVGSKPVEYLSKDEMLAMAREGTYEFIPAKVIQLSLLKMLAAPPGAKKVTFWSALFGSEGKRRRKEAQAFQQELKDIRLANSQNRRFVNAQLDVLAILDANYDTSPEKVRLDNEKRLEDEKLANIEGKLKAAQGAADQESQAKAAELSKQLESQTAVAMAKSAEAQRRAREEESKFAAELQKLKEVAEAERAHNDQLLAAKKAEDKRIRDQFDYEFPRVSAVVKKPAKSAFPVTIRRLALLGEREAMASGHLLKCSTKGKWLMRMFELRGPFLLYWLPKANPLNVDAEGACSNLPLTRSPSSFLYRMSRTM